MIQARQCGLPFFSSVDDERIAHDSSERAFLSSSVSVHFSMNSIDVTLHILSRLHPREPLWPHEIKLGQTAEQQRHPEKEWST